MSLTAGLHRVPSGHLAAVVTHLEMTAPADKSPMSFPDGCGAVREQLTVTDYKNLFRDVGAPWLWQSRLKMPDDALNDVLRNKDVETWVVRHSQAAVGLVELDFHVDDACEISFFGLVQSATGQGLGGAMVGLAQQQAFSSRPVARLHLCTCTLDSPQALGFYQRMGFTPYKRSVEIFPDPRQNGILSATSANQIPCL